MTLDYQVASNQPVKATPSFGGLDLPANFKRAEALLTLAKRFLPVIDRSRAAPNVLYAFSHGHLGLTQSAAIGRLIAELAGQQKPSVNLENLRFDRFSGR